MKKRLGISIFGVLLIVFCADGCAYQVQAKDNHQNPSAPIPIVPPQQPDGGALKGKEQKDIHADVNIVNPPQKDFYDKAPVWIDIALVVVALGTGIVIGLQTAQTKKAAEAALIGAKAAEKSAIAAMGVAIPTLMLSQFEFAPWSDPRGLAGFLKSPRVLIEVKNYGQSPAILKCFTVEFTCKDLPKIADYPPPEYFDVGTVVETGKTVLLDEKGVTSMETFTADDVRAIMNGDKYLLVYGRVWYGDVFGTTIHSLPFAKGLGGFNGEGEGMYWADLPNPECPEGYDPN